MKDDEAATTDRDRSETAGPEPRQENGGELSRLIGSRPAELDSRFAAAVAPDLEELVGRADGFLLRVSDSPERWARILRRSLARWKGKTFHGALESDGNRKVHGRNLWGFGALRLRCLRFEAYRCPSRRVDGDVVHLDHDLPGNPRLVRAMHDELRRVGDGLYLGQSHLRRRGGLVFACSFALEIRPRAGT